MAEAAERLDFFAIEAERRMDERVRVSLVPVLVVMYAALLPREMSFNVGGLAFYTDRIAYFIIMPWVMYKLFKGAIRFVLPDFLVVISAVWAVVSLAMIYDWGRALNTGGSQLLDSTVGYFLARISFRSLQDVRRALIVLAPGLAVIGFLLFLESVTHRFIVEPIAVAMFGRLHSFFHDSDYSLMDANPALNIRYGLWRAKANFSHSIHAGLYMTSMTALYWMSGIRGWPGRMGRWAAFAGLFTMSSAAFGTMALSLFGMGFEWLRRQVRELSWRLAFLGVGLVLIVAQLTTNIGAIGFVTRYLTFNASTAFYRQLIWTYGLDSVWAHPWFGIGYEDYERPKWMVTGSIDAHWLLLAVRSGLITAVTLFIATVMAIWVLAVASNRVNKVDRHFYRGIAIALFAFGVGMFTVALWGNLQSWFNILLGMCVACAQHSYRIGFRPEVVSDVKSMPVQARHTPQAA